MRRALLVIFLTGALVLLSLTILFYAPQRIFAKLSTASSTAHSSDQAAHYIVFQKQSDDIVTPLYYRQVRLAAPVKTLDSGQLTRYLARPNRNSEQMVVTLQSRSGRIVYQSIIWVPHWLRGEFHASAADGTIDGHLFPLEEAVFVVRVPVIDDTVLILKGLKDGQLVDVAQVNLTQLTTDTPSITLEAISMSRSIVQSTGDPANRIDLLIMGDGYTAARANDFATDANTLATQFFSISPYSEYINYVNINMLFTPSNESGADHPPYVSGCDADDPTCCGDPDMLDDPLQGTFVGTAFDSTYCAYNIHRLLVADTSAVLAAAAAVPDWDMIFLLVNDPTYGGSGGIIPTISLHSASVEIAQHEYGHSFADLADEYETPFPGYPPCSDISGTPCEPNVTDVNVRNQIKWSPWISPTTPIPTEPEFDPIYANVMGLFEGARYLSTGMYRSGQDCIMRTLGQPYCQVPSQAYVLKLYDGGWGVPASGISLIEPGTTLPATNSITLTHPATQTFQADILEPVGGPPVQITWLVNGIPIPGATGDTFTYTTSAHTQGFIEIKLVAEDTTPLVHPAMAGSSLQAVYTWTVEVIRGGPECEWDLDGDGNVDVDDIMLVANCWRMTTEDPDCAPYDLNGNGIINIVDIMLVVAHWGETCE